MDWLISAFGDEVINKDAIISIIRRLTKKDRDRELADDDCKKISNRVRNITEMNELIKLL